MLAEIKPRRFELTRLLLHDRWYLALSLVLQLVLGISFGHIYDLRISMATGYLVATGQNPYIPQDLSTVFHNPAFQGITSIGYPPSLPLLLGLLYSISYALIPNLLVYNLALKLPIIAANLGLAYLVRGVLKDQGVDQREAHKAWIFLLFNPFLIYFTTAWGQFDSLVAVLTFLSLVLLAKKRLSSSALLLALAISLKPISLPVVLVAIVYLWGKPWQRLVKFKAILSLSLVTLCVLPFILFNWDPTIILTHWNAVFTVSGGMSLVTLYELWKNTYTLPGMWWLLGFLWLPATLLAAFLVKFRQRSLVELIKNALVLILVFYLTRTWLSEPNLVLILPLVLILTWLGQLPRFALQATWILPLIFTVFNTSPPQLLFPLYPELIGRLLVWMDTYRSARLMLREVVVIPWHITGWWMAVRTIRGGPQ
jgi:uncharacterized membrane protein